MEWSFRTVRIKAWRYKATRDRQCKRTNNGSGKFENGFDEAGDHGRRASQNELRARMEARREVTWQTIGLIS
jgi:hypothetical protein